MIKSPVIAHLGKKLRLLYKAELNPAINSHSDLAKSLGVSRQAVSKWIHGTETTRGGSIPGDKMSSIGFLFSIEPRIFELSLEDFRRYLDKRAREIQEEARFYVDNADIGEPKAFLSSMPPTRGVCVGRDKELAFLSAAWKSEEVNLVQLIGVGGIGKSMLVNTWISDLENRKFDGAKSVYTWSFERQSGSGDSNRSSADLFIESALHWFGDLSYNIGSSWSKALKLLNRIRKSRTLLILDGIEALSRAPVDGMAELEDSSLNMLVRELMREMTGLCIVTSRLPLAIVDESRNPLIQSLKIPALEYDNSILVLKTLGLKNLRGERLESAIKYNQGHPLCLKLLAGYVRVVHSGDFAKWNNSVFVVDKYQQDSELENLMDSYFRWFKNRPELSILLLLSFFDGPAHLSLLQAFSEKLEGSAAVKELHEFDFATWQFAINELEKAMLIVSVDTPDGILLECHPLIRQHLTNFLKLSKPDDWINGHSALFALYSREEVVDVTSLSSLEPYLQSVFHACLAERHLEAFQVYHEKIKGESLYITPFGSHQTDLDFIRPFFKSSRVPWTEPVDSLPSRSKFRLLTYAATNLIYLGNIDLAISPMTIGIEGFLSENDLLSAAITTVPLYSMLIYTGRLDEAFQLYQKMHPYVRKLDNVVALAMDDTLRAFYHHLIGENDLALELFEKAHSVFSQNQAPSKVNFPIISYFHTMFLIETKGAKAGLDRTRETFGWRESGAWQCESDTKILLAMDHLCMGYSYLLLGHIDEASSHLNEQVRILRDAEDWMYLPHALNYRSLLNIKIGNLRSAMVDLDESIEIAERTGAKFIEWNARINYCLLYISKDNFEDVELMYEQSRMLLDQASYKIRFEDTSLIVRYLGKGS